VPYFILALLETLREYPGEVRVCSSGRSGAFTSSRCLSHNLDAARMWALAVKAQ